jgi:hypothetical protein
MITKYWKETNIDDEARGSLCSWLKMDAERSINHKFWKKEIKLWYEERRRAFEEYSGIYMTLEEAE